MPRKTNNSPPPEVMTWGRAAFILVIAVVFDLLRLFFEMFWFFGPALAAALCTIKAGAVVGMTIGGLACGAVAASVGALAFGAIETFGVVMAMAVGLAGWLVIGLILLMFNGRIFKENALWFGASLLLSEVPLLGAIPAITVSVWKMHSNQIKIEEAAYKKWEKENATAELQERQRQAAERTRFMQDEDNHLASVDV